MAARSLAPSPQCAPPICIDLFCGLGGWAEGFLAEGYRVIGFDNVRHDYGTGGYPGELVLQDVTTLHGSRFRDAAVIVASPPCQEYSYRAMPWERAKKLPPPDNTLFAACFRLQREASEAAGHFIPLVIENVRGAQKWLGPLQAEYPEAFGRPRAVAPGNARWHFGSYYLWGDVPALMPFTMAPKRAGRNFHGPERGESSPSFNGSAHETRHVKTSGLVNIRDGHSHTRHLTNQREHDAAKVPGISFSGHGQPGYKPQGFNVTAAKRYREEHPLVGAREDEGLKQGGEWWHDPKSITRRTSSRSDSRKAASAQIAKIPFPLAQWIASVYKPEP